MENWLKRRRKALDMTQEQLTAKLNLHGFNYTTGAISHWEQERFPVPIEKKEFLIALANILRMSEAEIVNEVHGIRQSKHSPAGERAAQMVDKMPENRQDAALRLLETLLEA